MIAFSTLLAPVDSATARAACVTRLVSYGVPANNWRPGGVFSTLLTVFCWLFASCSSVVTALINGLFLGTSSGGWLTALAYYVYGVTRQAATYGTATYTLTNTAGGVYSMAPGQFVCQCGLNGNLFTNQSSFSLGAGTPASPTVVTITIVAQQLGSLGGAPAGAITTIVSTMVGVTGTNPVACLGLDEWSDAKVVAACYAALAARSQKGPSGAYLAAIYGYSNVPGATNVVTGAPVNVNRVQLYRDPDTGNITCYLASPAGAADPDDVAGVQVAITAVAQPMGVTSTSASCAPVSAGGIITVWSTSAGLAAAKGVYDLALIEILSAFSQYPIGGRTKPPGTQAYLFASYVEALATRADPTIYAVDYDRGDLPLSEGQVATFTGAVLVRQVPVS